MAHGRRSFLRAGALGAAGMAAFPGLARANEWTAAEKANVQVVNAFCAAWATGDVAKITSYMTEDVIFRNRATPAMVGRQASFDRITNVFKQYPKIEFEVIESWARGSIVMDERKDWLYQAGKEKRLIHLVGVFVMRDGKIAEWTDYGLQ
jgi:limonene-1,2-epoxide hydrolase